MEQAGSVSFFRSSLSQSVSFSHFTGPTLVVLITIVPRSYPLHIDASMRISISVPLKRTGTAPVFILLGGQILFFPLLRIGLFVVR